MACSHFILLYQAELGFRNKTSQVVNSSLVTAKDTLIISSLTELVAEPVFILKGKQLVNATLQSKFFPCVIQEGNCAGKALSSAWTWSVVVEMEKDFCRNKDNS